MSCTIATFYHFFPFVHYRSERQKILDKMNALSIKGSVLIAEEGINSTIAGTPDAINEFLVFLKIEITGSDFEHKESRAEKQPFGRAKVRFKKEAISLGEDAPLDKVGIYVEPQDWNAYLKDPDAIVIDARNDYEVQLGTFAGALNPGTRGFKELPAFARKVLNGDKKRKVITFCTGGIRCEKFTSWLKGQGYENVFHLKGGILNYLKEVPRGESLWQGECYVFDDRVAVDHDLNPTKAAHICSKCGSAIKYKERSCASCAELISA